jgi:hypothetical protein
LAFDLLSAKTSQKSRIFLIYRPPSTNFIESSAICQQIKSFLLPKNNVLLGDLNCAKCHWHETVPPKNRAEIPIFNFAKINGFEQYVDFPTRISSSGARNILDIVLCDNPEIVVDCKPMPPLFNSDHQTVVFSLNIPQKLSLVCTKAPQFNYRKANFDIINSCLASFNWETQLGYFGTPQSKYDHFCKLFKEIFEMYTPVSTPNHTHISRKLKNLYKKRKSVLNDNHAYKLVQKEIKILRRRDKIVFEKKLLEQGKNKQFFRYVNGKLKDKNVIPSLVDPQNQRVAFSNEEKANLFAAEFSTNCSHNPSNSQSIPSIFPEIGRAHV